jgi:hypothetical protein
MIILYPGFCTVFLVGGIKIVFGVTWDYIYDIDDHPEFPPDYPSVTPVQSAVQKRQVYPLLLRGRLVEETLTNSYYRE